MSVKEDVFSYIVLFSLVVNCLRIMTSEDYRLQNITDDQHIFNHFLTRRPIGDKDLAEIPSLASIAYCKGLFATSLNKRGYK